MRRQAAERVLVSDRLWARVQPLLVERDPTAATAGRAWLEAILYQALSSEAWATLVQDRPDWQAAHAAAVRWQELGLLDQLSQLLLVRLSPP